MANDLTGDFDVVAEFSLGAADRILAAMHCAGRLPHSWSLRVDDFVHFKFPLTPKNLATGIRAVSDAFGNAVPNPQVVAKVSVSSPLICTSALLNPNQDSPVNLPTAAFGSAAIATHFSPGIIDRFGVGGLLTPGAAERASHLVGVAQLQMGAPTVTLVENSDTAVVVHTPVRARYTGDPDTLYIPDFLRGEFQTSITVKNVSSPAGAAIEVLLAGKSGNVNFVPNWVSPAWDSEPAQLTAINKALVNSLQSSFEPSTTPLPGNSILNLKFKTLADGPALAMLMDLPGGNPSGPPDPASVSNVFLADDDDFAFAVSDEFVQAMISRSVADLRAQRHSFTVTGRITIIPNPFGDDVTAKVSATYTVTVNSVTVALQDADPGFPTGRIVVTIQGSANTDSVWPDVNFTATQNLGLELIPSAFDSTADLIVLGDPSVDLHAPGITPDWIINPLKPNAVNVIKTNIANFLAEINPGLQQRLSVKANLGDFLNSLMNPPAKPGVSVTPLNSQLAYTSFEIFTSGIVLHGTLAVPPWPKAHTDFTFYTVGGFGPMPFARGEYNALNSWIPGGTIKEHIWNQQDGPTLRDDHGTFIFLQKNPDGLVHLCLTIKGTRISASGPITYDPVVAASFCAWHSHITVKEAVVEPAAQGRKLPKIALTQAAAHGGLQVVGHTSPWAAPGTSPHYTTNLIVHFPTQHSVSDLDFLIRAGNESGRADTATAIIVALSHGQLPLAKPTPGIIFSDDEKSWAHLLGMKEAPATFVIGTTGEVVWHHQGAVTADQLASALKKHLAPNAHFLPRTLESSLRIGQPVPNFLFESAPGHAHTLRKLAGRSAVLVFWNSTSQASIETLLDLQKTFDGAPDTAPVILAINDDDTPEVAHKLAAEHGLKSVLVVPDPARDIALAYGINVWPTAIFLDENGIVAGIRQGRFKQELATQPPVATAEEMR